MKRRPASFLLVLGAAAGALLAATGIVQGQPERVPDDAVALVDGRAIPRPEYERALRALKAERPNLPESELRAHVIERLVDEQLLIDSALELGLAERDPRVRAGLGAAAITHVLAGEAQPISEAEEREFFRANRDFFAGPARARVAHGVFDSRAAAEAYRPGADSSVPDVLLTEAQLAGYLGATLARHALEGGGIFTQGGRFHALHVREREPGSVPAFERVRISVRKEMARRRDERRLAEFLRSRRQNARIELADDLQ